MIIDIAAGLAFLLGFIRGYMKGIIGTIFAILAFVLAIISTLKLSPLFITALDGLMPNAPKLAYILGFLGTFFLVFVIITFIGKRVEGLFKKVRLNFINKLAGGIVTSLFFVLIFSTVLWFMNEARLIGEVQKDQSITYYQLEPIPEMAKEQFATLKPVFQEFWDKTIEVFDKARERGEEIQLNNTEEEM